MARPLRYGPPLKTRLLLEDEARFEAERLRRGITRSELAREMIHNYLSGKIIILGSGAFDDATNHAATFGEQRAEEWAKDCNRKEWSPDNWREEIDFIF